MIEILGVKRIAVLLFLLILNGILGAIVYGFLQPELMNKNMELGGAQARLSKVQQDLTSIRDDFEKLDSQRDIYARLKDKGFLEDPETARIQAEDTIEIDVKEKSGVVFVTGNISSGQVIDHPAAQEAGYKILDTPVALDITAMTDLDVFNYLDILAEEMPGYININNILISREGEINRDVLQAISGGAKPELVKASVKLDWKMLLPADAVLDSKTGGRR